MKTTCTCQTYLFSGSFMPLGRIGLLMYVPTISIVGFTIAANRVCCAVFSMTSGLVWDEWFRGNTILQALAIFCPSIISSQLIGSHQLINWGGKAKSLFVDLILQLLCCHGWFAPRLVGRPGIFNHACISNICHLINYNPVILVHITYM
jgi:hypothetical protein